jgi:hypothetical protein
MEYQIEDAERSGGSKYAWVCKRSDDKVRFQFSVEGVGVGLFTKQT